MNKGGPITPHPEFLSKEGKKEFVVLPYEEFLAIQELIEDAEESSIFARQNRRKKTNPQSR